MSSLETATAAAPVPSSLPPRQAFPVVGGPDNTSSGPVNLKQSDDTKDQKVVDALPKDVLARPQIPDSIKPQPRAMIVAKTKTFRLDSLTLATIHELSYQYINNKKTIKTNGLIERISGRFVWLSDTSSPQTLQLVFPDKKFPKFNKSEYLKVEGVLVATNKPSPPYELQVTSCVSTGPVREPGSYLPSMSQKQLEKVTAERWNQTPEQQFVTEKFARLMIASRLHGILFDFMKTLPVEAMHADPSEITSSDCEGAGEMFVVTAALEHNGSIKADCQAKAGNEIQWAKDHFRKPGPAFLTVSSQWGLEMMVKKAPIVWTTNKSFRAEPSDTNRHLAEFKHFEVEIRDINFSRLMDFIENCLGHCIPAVIWQSQTEYAMLEKLPSCQGLVAKLTKMVSKPFDRISYTEAIRLLETRRTELLAKFPEQKAVPKWGEDLGSLCEKFLSDVVFDHPVFVYNMPKGLKSFYMKQNTQDEKGKETVQGVDLLIPGMGELVGASVREEDWGKLLTALIDKRLYQIYESGSQSRPATDDEHKSLWQALQTAGTSNVTQLQDILSGHKVAISEANRRYLNLRFNASVPSAGFGMGFERFVAICTGAGSVRDCTLEPVAWKWLKS